MAMAKKSGHHHARNQILIGPGIAFLRQHLDVADSDSFAVTGQVLKQGLRPGPAEVLRLIRAVLREQPEHFLGERLPLSQVFLDLFEIRPARFSNQQRPELGDHVRHFF